MNLTTTDNTIASNQANYIAHKNRFNKFCGYAIDDKENTLSRREKSNVLVFVKKEKNKQAKYCAVLIDSNKKVINYAIVTKLFLKQNIDCAINFLKSSAEQNLHNIEENTRQLMSTSIAKISIYFNNVVSSLYDAANTEIDSDDNIVSKTSFDFLK